jgi:hypothetical protein
MKDYDLKEEAEPPSNKIVWTFDLGRTSIGEAVRQGTNILHKASLPGRAVAQRRPVIPPEFAETKTARDRRH